MKQKNKYDFCNYIFYLIFSAMAIIIEIGRLFFDGGNPFVCICTIILACFAIFVVIKKARVKDDHETKTSDYAPQTITINLSNGYKLVAEQTSDPLYSQEMVISILDPNGIWHQDLAIVRNKYTYKSLEEHDVPVFIDDLFEILVYSDKNNEDYTHSFLIELTKEE